MASLSSACSTSETPLLLTLRNDKTLEHYDVLKKKVNLIARAKFNGDMEIQNDITVSRSHAEIYLVKKTVGKTIKLYLKLRDKQSKFGTFINDGIETNDPIPSNHPIILNCGDRIRFGRMDNTWTVVTYPIVACPSAMNKVDKDILKKSLAAFGGQMTRDWSEQCTHLCMNTITVTEKALICLASAKSIVIPKYFIDLCEALSPNSLKEIPFCVDYLPVLSESLLNPSTVSLKVNNNRQTLFSGKTFICSTMEQLNRISKIIKAAGGKTINYFDGILTNSDILNTDGYIIMQQDLNNTEDDKRKMYQLILDKLEVANKRPILENDIGLAIIFANTVKYCNPNYDISLINLQSQQSNIAHTQVSEILAPETELVTVVDDSEKFSVNVVPDSHPETQSSFKRSLEVEAVMNSDDEIEWPQKRALMSYSKRKNNNNEKIRDEEDLEPLKKINKPVSSNSMFKLLEPIEPARNCISPNIVGSCVTSVPSSQNVSSNIYSPYPQTNMTKKNDNSSYNNLHSKIDENRAITKRTISSVSSMVNNEDDDPFDYMDIDEVEGQPKKKLRKHTESIFFPLLKSMSTDKDEELKSSVPIVDVNFIMSLLSEAKDTGDFIDTSIPSTKSRTHENIENSVENNDLINSVIVETVKMVVSKPTKITQNSIQGSSSHLTNFKKFKRKAPAMRIPNIIPLELV